MPGNAGYTMLMFPYSKRMALPSDLSLSHSDRGGATDLATLSHHLILFSDSLRASQNFNPVHRCYSPNASFVGLFFTFLALFPVKLSWQALLQFLQNVRCQGPGFEGAQQYRNSTEITRVGAHKFDL